MRLAAALAHILLVIFCKWLFNLEWFFLDNYFADRMRA